MKKCSKCKKEKPKTDFYKDKRTKDALYSCCKKCQLMIAKPAIKKWMKKNREHLRKYSIEWRGKNKEHIREYGKKYLREYMPKWITKNKEHYREYRREYTRKYYKKYVAIPKNRLDSNIKCLIWLALKGKKAGRRWEELVGYTIDDLTKHLEKQFDKKMNWENYGTYWEVDHIKPRSLFKYETSEDPEFKKCWALENLQPLEKKENRKKYNKYDLTSKNKNILEIYN